MQIRIQIVHKSKIDTKHNNYLIVFTQECSYIDLSIILFALSTTDVSNEARYIRVVFSESCPIASLMVEMGIFLLFAMLAQPWRAT